MENFSKIEKRKQTNIKIFKIFLIPIAILGLILIVGTISRGETPKTKAQIVLEKKDSIQADRVDKINLGLIFLETKIKENMKNPDSYDKISEDYDRKDTLDTVKMYIRFRGDNSFGGKSITRVDAVYNFKTDNLDIVSKATE
jgi:hypothetical protein